MMDFVLKTRNFVSKMMNFAARLGLLPIQGTQRDRCDFTKTIDYFTKTIVYFTKTIDYFTKTIGSAMENDDSSVENDDSSIEK